MTRKTSFLLPFLVFVVASGSAFSADNYATEDYVDEQYIDVVGYIDSKNRTLKNTMTSNDNQLFANQELLRDMLNTKDGDGNWVTLDTEEQLAIPAINELHAELGDIKAAAESAVTDEEVTTAIDNALADYTNTTDMNVALEAKANVADLAAVATSGLYSDLEGVPEIPSLDGLVSAEELAAVQTALEASIAEKQEKGEYLVASDLTALNEAITALQTGKADASTVTTIQETISKLGDTYATKADMTAADEALQSAIDNMDLSAYAKTADVEATYATKESVALKADASALAEYAKTADVESALGAKEDAANKLTSATADEIEAMSSDDKAKKFPSVAVAQTIANAAVTKVNEVAGDLSTLQTQVGTNTADIAEIKSAGYQTADDVSGIVETATADFATKGEVEAVSTVANAAAVKADVDAALENIYTKTEVDAAIGAINEYDDTALAARVTVNEGAIATNTAGVADNKSAIETLQNAGYVKGTNTSGSYLVNFDASGNVSYAAVEILDAAGQPIDLASNAVK